MRPKKKILLIDPNEARRSTRRFALANWGYVVHAVANAEDARQAAAAVDPDLAVLCLPCKDAEALLKALHRLHPHTPSLVLGEQLAEVPRSLIADGYLLKNACSSFEIRERVKIMCIRKRGPRKGARRFPVQSVDLDSQDVRRIA